MTGLRVAQTIADKQTYFSVSSLIQYTKSEQSAKKTIPKEQSGVRMV
jgi:hypothetical protein